jgi:tetratricopeptide (TPR) repeat protein
MLTLMFRLVLISVVVVAAAGCGGGGSLVKTVTRDPNKKEAKQLVTEAREQAGRGQNEQADRSYSEAYATANETPKVAWDILVEWVEFLQHTNRSGRARDIAKQYYEANPADPKGYHLYAEALIRNNKGQEALEVASQLIQISDDAAAHDKRGRALLLLERPEEGIEELRKAVELDSASAKYHMSLGLALHRIGEVNKAALEFRAALKSAPEDPEAHVLLGMALRDQSELDEAKTYLDRALEIDPKNGAAYFELGVLYNRQLKQAEAEQAFGKAVRFSPNESRFWYAYGEIYRVQERFDDAIAAYRRSMELDPPYVKASGKLGTVLVEKKQYEDAEQYLIQAIRKEPKNAANYFWLGKSYAGQRKKTQAIDNFELYLKYAQKNDADRDKAKELINQLKRK